MKLKLLMLSLTFLHVFNIAYSAESHQEYKCEDIQEFSKRNECIENDPATYEWEKPELTSECWGAGNTIEQAACLGKEQKDIEKSLNTSYQQLLDATAKIDSKNVREISDAHKKWLDIREDYCEDQGKLLEGGSGQYLVKMDCIIRLSKERITHLNNQFENIAVGKRLEK